MRKVHETMRVEASTSAAIRRLAASYGSKGAVVDAAVRLLEGEASETRMARAQGRVELKGGAEHRELTYEMDG